MELTNIKEQEFIDSYMNRYALPWETSIECSERIVNKWIEANPSDEFAFFKSTLKKLLWSRAWATYKMRDYWVQTVLDKFTGELWLNYGPRCLDTEWKPIIKYLKTGR